MNRDDYYWVFRAMEVYGGSFCKTLADLWWRADQENSLKILKTWANYIDDYQKFAERLKEKEGLEEGELSKHEGRKET